MSYKEFRLMDLSFFTVIGVITVLISEGLFAVLPNVEFSLSLIFLVAFIGGIRWGIFGFIPYFISLLVMLFFNNNLENWPILVPYYIVSALSFIFPIEIARKKKLYNKKSTLVIIIIFLVSFFSQSIFNSIYYGFVSNENVLDFFIKFVAHNLLNVVIVLLFTAILYSTSNLLFQNMDNYLIKVQEGLEEDDE